MIRDRRDKADNATVFNRTPVGLVLKRRPSNRPARPVLVMGMATKVPTPASVCYQQLKSTLFIKQRSSFELQDVYELTMTPTPLNLNP